MDAPVIIVTRLNGPQFGLNPDLLMRVEETPDTVLTLVDGTKFIVAEPVTELVSRIIQFRAQVVAAASVLEPVPTLPEPVSESSPSLRALPGQIEPDSVAPAVPLRPSGGDDGSC